MMMGTRVPIRTRPAVVPRQVSPVSVPVVTETISPVMARKAAKVEEPVPVQPESEETLEVWRDRALRLQAEMENFRKRQRRLADERVEGDRERLLRAFLRVADDLERALNAEETDAKNLRQGVDMTYQALMQLLGREGVERIEAQGQPFDPTWHEAIGTVFHQETGAKPDTVIKVTQPGYRLGQRLLRPARVVVAT
jgi:molecular chaperone GrpE